MPGHTYGSDNCWSSCSRRVGNHRLPQEAEGLVYRPGPALTDCYVQSYQYNPGY